MPTTTRITNHKLINDDHNINIDKASSSTTETNTTNTNTNNNTNSKKLIKKKSFWSHSSLASSSLLSSNTTTCTNKSSSSQILFNGKRTLQDKISEIFLPVNNINNARSSNFSHTQSFRLASNTKPTTSSKSKNENSNKLVKSNTMNLNERRRLQTNLTTSRLNNQQPINSYDKLLFQNTVQKDELSFQQYSHIYKEFTSDCLRPFFDQQQIDINLNDSTQSDTPRVLSSIVEASNETPSSNQDPQRYIYIAAESTMSSLSSSSSLKTHSQSSLEHKNQSPILSYKSDSTNSNKIKPVPQPRSIYLNYDKQKDSNEPSHFYPIDSQNIIPSSSSSSSPTSSSNSPQCPINNSNNKPTCSKTVNATLVKNSKSISCGESINSPALSSLSVNSSLQQPHHLKNQSNLSHSRPQLQRSITMGGEEYEDIRDEETEKKRISKGKIIDELIQTEMDYYKVMKLLYDVYLGPNSENIIESAQKELIFCNLRDIMKLSSLLLNDFENNILNKPFEKVKIGKCFLNNANSIRQIYAHYAQYIEYSNNILEKNEKVPDVQRFIQNGLNIIKQQTTSAFDLHSLLLKPIQRVLKYPLLLQELIKNTEVYHEDFQDLNKALTCMQDVATYINEIKRRRDLIVKYGRKDSNQSSIHDKMSKLTIHSMIKKSNRISMKLSNVLGLHGVTTVDEEFDRLEIKFHYFEKLIKCFCKDSMQHLANLKDFFKTQTITAESVQEYYGDYQSDEILQYVHINAQMLNEIYTKNTNFVHEKVLQPLNNLLKLLEVPNKLILKRRDKLLDYEFAKTNYEKLKDKNFIKAIQDNLFETQKNYEALNNQLLEELPILIEKCSIVFEKCFLLYLTALKNIHERIRFQLKSLNTNFEIVKQTSNTDLKHNKNQIGFNLAQIDQIWEEQLTHFSEKFNIKQISNYKSDSSLEKLNTNLSRKMSFNSRTNTRLHDLKRKKTLFNNPVVQMLKNLTGSDNPVANTPKPTHKAIANKPDKQNEEIRNKLMRTYKKEDLYLSCAKYAGFGITSELTLEIDDLVGVLKKSDPCGNQTNWFVDNGIVKGIISSSILKPYENKNFSPKQPEFSSELGSLGSFEDERINSSNTSEIIESQIHNYVNSDEDNSNNNTNNTTAISTTNNSQTIEYCRALYPFQAIDDTTLTINEGDSFKVIQKHDDNFNDEWWLVEKINNQMSLRIRGYVPANYVELVDSLKIDNEIPIDTIDCPIDVECEKRGIQMLNI